MMSIQLPFHYLLEFPLQLAYLTELQHLGVKEIRVQMVRTDDLTRVMTLCRMHSFNMVFSESHCFKDFDDIIGKLIVGRQD